MGEAASFDGLPVEVAAKLQRVLETGAPDLRIVQAGQINA